MTFQELLDANGVPYLQGGHHHCRPGWIQLDCPFCGNGSGKYHMGYSIAGRFVSCWRCRGHPLAETLSELTGKDVRECKRLLKDVEKSDEAFTVPDVRGTLIMPAPIEELGKAHRDYLRSRNLDKKTAELWGLKGLGPMARVKTPAGKKITLSFRVLIPYHFRGKIVSWTTRSIIESVDQRYIAAPAECEKMDHKALLFGEDFCGHAACAVEGEFDTMRIGPGAVGVSGTAYKTAQVNRLARFPVRAVCFDNEPDAQLRAMELVDQLSAFPGKTFNIVLDSNDPGSATDQEIARLRRVLRL